MKRLFEILLFTVTLVSCSDNGKENGESGTSKYYMDDPVEMIKISEHKDLIGSEVRMVGDMSSDNVEQLQDSCSKIFISRKTSDEVLSIISYFGRSGCTNYQANIDIRGDSLVLLLENTTNLVCAEREYYRVTYHVNTSGKNYIITK